MVSVEADSTQAMRPTKESAPKRSKISEQRDKDPPPERGRINANGTIGDGIDNASHTGAINPIIKSSAPDARNTLTEIRISIIVGKIRRQV